jgi:hypothetical protein
MPVSVCANCSKKQPEAKTISCPDCKSVRYCSKKCLDTHKEKHSEDCRKPVPKFAPSTNNAAANLQRTPSMGLQRTASGSASGGSASSMNQSANESQMALTNEIKIYWQEHVNIIKSEQNVQLVNATKAKVDAFFTKGEALVRKINDAKNVIGPLFRYFYVGDVYIFMTKVCFEFAIQYEKPEDSEIDRKQKFVLAHRYISELYTIVEEVEKSHPPENLHDEKLQVQMRMQRVKHRLLRIEFCRYTGKFQEGLDLLKGSVLPILKETREELQLLIEVQNFVFDFTIKAHRPLPELVKAVKKLFDVIINIAGPFNHELNSFIEKYLRIFQDQFFHTEHFEIAKYVCDKIIKGKKETAEDRMHGVFAKYYLANSLILNNNLEEALVNLEEVQKFFESSIPNSWLMAKLLYTIAYTKERLSSSSSSSSSSTASEDIKICLERSLQLSKSTKQGGFSKFSQYIQAYHDKVAFGACSFHGSIFENPGFRPAELSIFEWMKVDDKVDESTKLFGTMQRYLFMQDVSNIEVCASEFLHKFPEDSKKADVESSLFDVTQIQNQKLWLEAVRGFETVVDLAECDVSSQEALHKDINVALSRANLSETSK